MTEKSHLWSEPPAPREEGNTESNLASPKPRWSTNRRIRWGLLDPLIALALTLASQLGISMVMMFLYISQNAQQINELTAEELETGLMDYVLSGPFLFIGNMLMYASWWVALHFARRKGFKSYAKDFWLKYRFPRDILLGFGLALLLRGLEFGVMFILEVAGVDLTGADNSSIIVGMDGIWYFLTAIIMAGILGPFMEELLFRGLGLQVLLRAFQHPRLRWNARNLGNGGNPIGAFVYKSRVWLSILLSSTVFGFMHFQGVETFGQWFVVIWTGLIGVALAWMTFKAKRLGPAIFTHIFFNLSGVLLATFIGS